MNSRALKTANELRDMIVEQAAARYGSWPAGMTLFVFDDAYGWTASISQPTSEADIIYRTWTIDLITRLRTRYDLDAPRLAEPDDIF
jgi:hypothetical protein